jgi:hypothetical protein
MPYYDFLNHKTGEIKTLFFGMNEDKIYVDSDGYEWKRQFSVPMAAIDTQNDAFDDKKNLEKIKNTKGSLGDILDYSKEQSIKREEKLGTTDPKKQAYYDKYAADRNGKRHLNEKKEKLEKTIKEVTIKYNKRNK